MKRLVAVLALTAGMLGASTPAWADLEWGADAFSSRRGFIGEAELAVGTTFESDAFYSHIDRPELLTGKKIAHALESNALIYLNINSLLRRSDGVIIPACFTDVAAGLYDDEFHVWAQGIVALDYPNMVITFNHEPMLNSESQPKCSHTYDNGTTYRAAFSHVEKLFKADGVTAPWAYVMTWAATQWSGGLDYRPAPRNFQVIGTDQYFRCNNAGGHGLRIQPPVPAADQDLVDELDVPRDRLRAASPGAELDAHGRSHRTWTERGARNSQPRITTGRSGSSRRFGSRSRIASSEARA
jgi:hypothetical protein